MDVQADLSKESVHLSPNDSKTQQVVKRNIIQQFEYPIVFALEWIYLLPRDFKLEVSRNVTRELFSYLTFYFQLQLVDKFFAQIVRTKILPLFKRMWWSSIEAAYIFPHLKDNPADDEQTRAKHIWPHWKAKKAQDMYVTLKQLRDIWLLFEVFCIGQRDMWAEQALLRFGSAQSVLEMVEQTQPKAKGKHKYKQKQATRKLTYKDKLSIQMLSRTVCTLEVCRWLTNTPKGRGYIILSDDAKSWSIPYNLYPKPKPSNTCRKKICTRSNKRKLGS